MTFSVEPKNYIQREVCVERRVVIGLWEERPSLFDTTSRQYSERVQKTGAWEQIAFAMKVPGKLIVPPKVSRIAKLNRKCRLEKK